MSKFIIRIQNDIVSVLEVTDSIHEPLTREGEEHFAYSPSFWNWFKEKIDYEGEKLSFIVALDKPSSFAIPEDIQIAEESAFVQMPILPERDDITILAFPSIEESAGDTARRVLKNDIERSLVDFFIEKTTKLRKLDMAIND